MQFLKANAYTFKTHSLKNFTNPKREKFSRGRKKMSFSGFKDGMAGISKGFRLMDTVLVETGWEFVDLATRLLVDEKELEKL